MKYIIFVPCYNEEKCLEANIIKLNNYLANTHLDYKIVLVDDCSTDETPNIIEHLSKTFSDIDYDIYEGKKPSRRENLLNAIRYFIAEEPHCVVAFLDCDLSTDIKDLETLLTNTKPGTICIGDRYDKQSVISRSRFRFLVSKCLNLYTKLLFNTKLNDHFIGFKSFHSNDFLMIMFQMGVSTARSMWADAEMLIWARKCEIDIKTIPVTWTESKFTKLNFKREFKILLYSLCFRLRLWIN